MVPSLPCCVLSGWSLHKSHTCCHSLWKFIHPSALFYQGNAISLKSSTTYALKIILLILPNRFPRRRQRLLIQNTSRHQILSTKEINYPGGTSGRLGWVGRGGLRIRQRQTAEGIPDVVDFKDKSRSLC